MLRYIEEFGKCVEITGFCNARIGNIDEFLKEVRGKKTSNVEIQFFNANLVATWQHLHFAVLNALTAFKNKQNLSKSLAMETMLYASAQRQIQKATEIFGIKPGASKIAVLVIGEKPELLETTLKMILTSLRAQLDEKILELSKEKESQILRTFGISDLELKTAMEKGNLRKALTNLVIERMALIATQL